MNCPFCNKELPDNAKFCSRCGGKIPTGGTANIHKTNSMPPKVRYCKDCGAEITGNDEYCDNCMTKGLINEPTITGYQEPNYTTNYQIPPMPPKKKKSIVPTILLIVLCVLLSFSAIFLGYSYVTKSFLFKEDTEETIEKSEDDNGNIQIISNGDETSASPETMEDDESDAILVAQQYRKDAVEYNGHAYAIFNYKEEGLTSFNGCEEFCEKRGGHLAVIDDQAENDFLYNYVQDCGLTLAFFGYSDQKEEGDWRWVNGSTSTYTNWCRVYGKEQPNNGRNNSSKASENYAEFYKDTADGTWNDAAFGKNTYRFICEWE